MNKDHKKPKDKKKETPPKPKKGHWLCGSTDSKEIERATNAMLGTSSGEFD